MEVSAFFSKLVRSSNQKDLIEKNRTLDHFQDAWSRIKDVLEHPDEKQILQGINSTDVPANIQLLVDYLGNEAKETGEDTGVCLEYFLNEDIYERLVQLSDRDVPVGIKSAVLRASTDLLQTLPDRFLVHNAIHHCLRQLISSTIGDAFHSRENLIDGSAKPVGAAASQRDHQAVSEAQKQLLAENQIELEADLVVLLLSVSQRMFRYPPLLLIIFSSKSLPTSHPTSSGLNPSPSNATMEKTSSQLFNFIFLEHLLRFVHREGELGNKAREGVLLLLEMAFDLGTGEEMDDPALRSTRLSLGRHFLLGSLIDVLVAGIGAVYSTLPNKVRLPTPKERFSKEAGMHLDLAVVESTPTSDHDIELNSGLSTPWTSEDLREQLQALARVINFIDAIIDRCNHGSGSVEDISDIANEIRTTIYSALQSSFLENILYAALLESSVTDGSATAVAMYLCWLTSSDLRTEKPFLLSESLFYLMGADVSKQNEATGLTPALFNTTRFTIKDFILDVLANDLSEASEAVLTLLATILDRFCPPTSVSVIGGIPDSEATALVGEVNEFFRHEFPEASHKTTTGQGNADNGEDEAEPDLIVQTPTNMVSISPFATMSNTPKINDADANLYTSLLSDSSELDMYVEIGYETISATRCLTQTLQGVPDVAKDHVRGQAFDHYPHRLYPQDPIIQELVRLTRFFFRHTATYNVALTSVWSSLITCPCRSLEGWIRAPKQTGTANDPFTDTKEEDVPVLFTVLKHLASQLAHFRSTVPNFDVLLDERRRGLLYLEGISDALHDNLPASNVLGTTSSSPLTSPGSSRRRPFKLASTLSSFMSPKRSSKTSDPDMSLDSANAPVAPQSSPMQVHYAATTSATIQPVVAKPIEAGPWSPRRGQRPTIKTRVPIAARGQGSDTVSLTSSGLTQHVRLPSENENEPITLSSALDNCIVLDQFIREIIGLLLARNILGIDRSR